MVKDQYGEVIASNSEGERVFGVFDPTQPLKELPSNDTLNLDFERPQKVTELIFNVGPNVESANVTYLDDKGAIVSYHKA